MPIDQIVKEATHLPDEYVAMAVSYIQFLQSKANSFAKRERSPEERECPFLCV